MAGYKIGKYTKQPINVNALEVDCENFRIGLQNSQPDAIRAMLNRSGTKLIGIANSIIENGFLDLESICIFPSTNKGKYIVAEGNRRITTLKILHTPELAKGTKLYEDFKALSKKTKNLPLIIECAVFKNRIDSLAYVLMRHGFTTGGAEVIRWNSLSKLRADEVVNNTSHPELRVIEAVLNKGSLSATYQQRIADDDFNITNLARLTDDKGVKKLLHINGNDCTVSDLGEDWLLLIWQRIIETIIAGQHKGRKFTVDTHLNNTEQRQDFIREVIEDVHGIVPTPASSPISIKGGTAARTDPSPSSTGSGTGKSSGTNSPSGKGKGGATQTTTKNRKGLIQKSFSPAGLSPQKVINLVDELKKLPVTDFENCAGVMFRVFFELSIVHYMKVHRITKINPNTQKEYTLKDKTKNVIKYLGKQGIDVKDLKPLNALLNNNHAISAETLNQYVHSLNYQPDANTLKKEWDNLQHLLDMMWAK